MSQQTELQGFLSVKIPPKIRGFLPWKTWKRQWISIRCLPAGGIDLIVGRNSQNVLHLSPNDIIVRTQSRYFKACSEEKLTWGGGRLVFAYVRAQKQGFRGIFPLRSSGWTVDKDNGYSRFSSEVPAVVMRICVEGRNIPRKYKVCKYRSHLYAFGIYPREGTTANFCLAGTSESESQKWISTFRKLLRPPLLPVEEDEFSVSVIDNTFTRSSGFPGLYGILRVNNSGLTITDPSTSKVTAHWPWHQLSHLYIASAFSKEDSGRICTVITSREFPTGSGKIRIFCLEALCLIRRLTMGKTSNCVKMYLSRRSTTHRHHTFSYDYRNKDTDNSRVHWIQPKRRTSSVSDPTKHERRLSKSEGNLLSLFDQLDESSECSDSGFIQDFYNNLFSACISDNDHKQAPDSENSPRFEKIGPSIVSSGIDLVTMTSIKSSESIHVYQELGGEVDDDANQGRSLKSFPRRQSGASVASGVYEEIDELSTSFKCSLNTVEEHVPDLPPPLPPRRGSFNKRLKSNTYQSASTLQLPNFQNKYISKSAGNTPLPSPPSLSRTASSTEFFSVSWQKEDESHYLPMNSHTRCLGNYPKKESPPEEQHYVDMSSILKEHS